MKSKYTKSQFFTDVKQEAESLKKFASPEEIELLDFDTFDPDHKRQCIYGQMTGSCLSERAAILINKCCKRFIKNGDHEDDISEKGFEIIKKDVNGSKVRGFLNERTNNYVINHFSSIEAYIMMPNAKNENLINYLKGETKKLVL